MATPRTPPPWRLVFLRELARSGNVTSAARACGIDRSTPYQLRRGNAAFAASWDRARAAACERLERHGGVMPTASRAGEGVARDPAPGGGGRAERRRRPLLRAGEVVRDSPSGKPRIERVGQGKWSSETEAAFLAELTATANVSAAARAAGVSQQCVYMRRRRYPAFSAEWDAAVAEGFARIETLVVCAATTTLEPEPVPDRAWDQPRMSMELAVSIWRAHIARAHGAGTRRLGGPPRREPDIEEVRQEILRKVAAIRNARGQTG